MSEPFRICVVLIFSLPALGFAQENAPPLEEVASPTTVASLARARGLISLDVTVTDKSGRPVTGLEAKDFTLLDNGQPQKILSFQAFDAITTKPVPAVEVILVINLSSMSDQQAEAAKHEAEKFLRSNDGHLAQPVSIYLLTNSKTVVLTGPSPCMAFELNVKAMLEENSNQRGTCS
jgi:VWFA-related protein